MTGYLREGTNHDFPLSVFLSAKDEGQASRGATLDNALAVDAVNTALKIRFAPYGSQVFI